MMRKGSTKTKSTIGKKMKLRERSNTTRTRTSHPRINKDRVIPICYRAVSPNFAKLMGSPACPCKRHQASPKKHRSRKPTGVTTSATTNRHRCATKVRKSRREETHRTNHRCRVKHPKKKSQCKDKGSNPTVAEVSKTTGYRDGNSTARRRARVIGLS